MKGKFLLLISAFLAPIMILVAQEANEWESNAKSIWTVTIFDMGYDIKSFQEAYPSFPTVISDIDDVSFAEQVYSWKQNNANEYHDFVNSTEYKKFNFSLVALGLAKTADDKNKFQDAWWEYIEASGISDERLQAIAPHLPKPDFKANDLIAESESYKVLFQQWQKTFPFEYNDLVNSSELVASNPYYEGDMIVASIPSYIKSLQASARPVQTSYQDAFSYQEDLMAWFVVFDLENFEAEFGFAPQIPSDFDLARYRTEIKRNIEFKEKENK